MNFEKINPWNWYKHEDVEPGGLKQVPVARDEAGALATESNPNSLQCLNFNKFI